MRPQAEDPRSVAKRQDWRMSAADVVAAGGGIPTLLLEFGLLVVGLGVLSRLAAGMGMSGVPFYLLAGLAFGDGGLAPVRFSESLVETAAQLGAIMLLLLLGLEYSARELTDTLRTSWRAGLIDLVLNCMPGVLVAAVLGWGVLGMVAMGGITYVSSSGITSQVMRDLKWRRNPEARGVVSILVIEDLAMAPYLPIVTTVATGVGLVTGLISVAVALVVVGLVLLLAVHQSHWISNLLSPRYPAPLLLTVFGAAVAAAGLAELVGFSGAVAAFLVGLLLTGEVADVARERLSPLRDLFAAVFFVFFGLNTDPREIPGVLPIALVLLVLAVATKFATGWALARSSGLSALAGQRAGALLSGRGEFSILVAGIVAIGTGAPPQLAALAATFVLLSAIVGPVLARLLQGKTQRELHPDAVASAA